jgi:hypothetical protein
MATKNFHAVRGRFMTFQLSARPVEIESGSHCCVRLSARDVNAIVIPFMLLDSRIEQVSCQQAAQEAGEYKRIDLKRVNPAAQAEMSTSPDFPK